MQRTLNKMLAGTGMVLAGHLVAAAQVTPVVEQRSHSAAASDERRDWTPRDSVELTYFLGDQNFMDPGEDPQAIVVSPNGHFFFFVAYRGDLSCGCNIFDLSVFSSHSVRAALRTGVTRSPMPLRHVRVLSSDPTPFAIRLAKWDQDSRSIEFLSVNESGQRKLCRLDVASGQMTTVMTTNARMDSRIYAEVGDTVIYTADVPKVRPATPATHFAHSITRDDLAHYLQPGRDERETVTFVSYPGRPQWSLRSFPVSAAELPVIGPDAKKAVGIQFPARTPREWLRYDSPPTLSTADLDVHRELKIAQFIMINAELGTSRPVFDAPVGTVTAMGRVAALEYHIRPRALWSRDGKHVLLVNTTLPLGGWQDDQRTHLACLAAIDADTGEWKLLEPLSSVSDRTGAQTRVSEVEWLIPGEKLLVLHKIVLNGKALAGKATVYSLNGGEWVGKTVREDLIREPREARRKLPRLADGLTVSLRQNANSAPVVVASDGRRELVLANPNEKLNSVRMAMEEPFHWKGVDGQAETGGLLLPRGIERCVSQSNDQAVSDNAKEACRAVPLVIQISSYDPDVFQPDGSAPNGYAAQSLVARGFAVLNVNIKRGVMGKPTEGPATLAMIQAAEEALSTRGIADRSKIGLIGFSRAGFEVLYVISHSGAHPPAAAIVDDSFTGAYAQYLMYGVLGTESTRASWEMGYGGSFWEKKDSWLAADPGFNIDQVETPTLFTVHGAVKIPGTFSEFGAFVLNHRPLEYLAFPEGGHELERPQERLISLEASADWLAFWLNGYEDPSPNKVEQYERWRALRVLDQQRKATDPRS